MNEIDRKLAACRVYRLATDLYGTTIGPMHAREDFDES